MNMPDVPNWLQWIVTILTPSVILWSVIRYLWRKWLSDLWAKRNRESAMKKAEILVKQYREALYLVDDDRRFQAVSTMVISNLIASIIVMVIGISFGGVALGISAYTQLSNFYFITFFSAGLTFFLAGVQSSSNAMEKRRISIKPYIDWVEYYEDTLTRIRSLLATAGLNDEAQAEFINDVVNIVDEEIIGHDDGDVDEN
jgi:hypothetical protein